VESHQDFTSMMEHMGYTVSFAIASICDQEVFRVNMKPLEVFSYFWTSYRERVTLQGGQLQAKVDSPIGSRTSGLCDGGSIYEANPKFA
jgi:hypothetical protein